MHSDFPGERIVLCYNPIFAEDRRWMREVLLYATETTQEKIRAWAGKCAQLASDALLKRKTGVVLGKYKMGKCFNVTIENGHLSWSCNEGRIAEEMCWNGLYAVRTSEMPRCFRQPCGVYKELEKAAVRPVVYFMRSTSGVVSR